MKLLADENFPPSLVSYLQKKQHNVTRIQRSTKGTSDIRVREIAQKENRIIITFDQDFLTKDGSEINTSVMLFKFPNLKPEEITPFMEKIIQAISDLKRKKKPFVATYSKDGLEILSK